MTGVHLIPEADIIVEEQESEEKEEQYGAEHPAPLLSIIDNYFDQEEREGGIDKGALPPIPQRIFDLFGYLCGGLFGFLFDASAPLSGGNSQAGIRLFGCLFAGLCAAAIAH